MSRLAPPKAARRSASVPPVPTRSAPPVLISASRRTDIPRYYAKWFESRRRQQYAEFRTAYGVRGCVSLAPADVLGYVFWTRDARPFESQIRSLRSEGARCAFQFTIVANGRDLEPHSPELGGALDSFLRISALLPEPESIQWRYDPIVLADAIPPAHHVSQFLRIASALRGATRVVNVSIVEPYAKALRRVSDPTVRYRAPDPHRHPSVIKRYPELRVADDVDAFLLELADVAREHGMELRVCCNPEYGQFPSQCIGPELFAPYGVALGDLVCSSPSRSACRCLRSIDIGMDNTCIAGCKYCYVVTSQEAAVGHFRQHDPESAALRR